MRTTARAKQDRIDFLRRGDVRGCVCARGTVDCGGRMTNNEAKLIYTLAKVFRAAKQHQGVSHESELWKAALAGLSTAIHMGGEYRDYFYACSDPDSTPIWEPDGIEMEEGL